MFGKKLILSLSIFVLVLPFARAGGDHWEVDYDKALDLAAKSGKDLLVDFSGSDWCGWCKKLDKEVFSQDLFKEKAPENFILVVLDFPRSEDLKRKIKNPEQNNELKNHFNVSGFPTVILLDSTGTPYAQTGYMQGGAEAYLKHLDELKSSPEIAKINAFAEEIDSARTAKAKSTALLKALEYYNEIKADRDLGRQFGINFLQFHDAAVQSLTWDPDNSSGLKLKAAEFLLERGVTGPKLHKAFKELDPNNDKGNLEKYLMAEVSGKLNASDWKGAVAFVESFVNDLKFREGDTEAKARYYAGYACQMLEDNEKARTYYKEALALKPASKGLVGAIERNLKKLDSE
jgi:thioredoxin-related protein